MMIRAWVDAEARTTVDGLGVCRSVAWTLKEIARRALDETAATRRDGVDDAMAATG
jgi:hypothetical protein